MLTANGIDIIVVGVAIVKENQMVWEAGEKAEYVSNTQTDMSYFVSSVHCLLYWCSLYICRWRWC